MNKWMGAVAALVFTFSAQAGYARPIAGHSPALRQALANVKVQQQQRMRAELRASWARMHDQLAQAQVAAQPPAAIESTTVRAAP